MSYLFEFEYHNPTAIHFGPGRIARLREVLPAQVRILWLYGGGSIRRNGVYAAVREALKDWTFVEFSGVTPNPDIEALTPVLSLIRAEGLDFILAVGGGSVIDAGKFLAIAAVNEGNPWDLVIGRRSIERALPLGAVLTLPATGSESNGTSVISRRSTCEKKAFRSPLMRPCFAILDPQIALTLPDRQLANGLVDAFVHACEQYLTRPVGAMVQEGYAEAVLRALYRLACTFERRHAIDWCQNLMWAANQALAGLLGVGVPQDWATHAIGRELTALYNLDHARTLSIAHPALLRETVAAKAAKLVQMGHEVFRDNNVDAMRVIARIEDLYRHLQMPLSLPEAGVDDPNAVDRLLNALHPQQNQLCDLDPPALRRVLRALSRGTT